MKFLLITVLLYGNLILKDEEAFQWNPALGQIPNCLTNRSIINSEGYLKAAQDLMYGKNGCEKQVGKALDLLLSISPNLRTPEIMYQKAIWFHDFNIISNIEDEYDREFYSKGYILANANTELELAARKKHPKATRALWELLKRSDDFISKNKTVYFWALMLKETNQPLPEEELLSLKNKLNPKDATKMEGWAREKPKGTIFTNLPRIRLNPCWLEGYPTLSLPN